MRQRTKRLAGAVAVPLAGVLTFSAVTAQATPGQTAPGQAVPEPEAGESSDMRAAVTTDVGTHNVLKGAAAFKPIGDVIGWQEVNDPADRKKLKKSLPRYNHFIPKKKPARAVPISWRQDTFTFVRGRAVLTHKGEAKVTPNRYVTWALLKHRKTDKRLIVMNTHFISGAWSKHPNRQGRWLKHAKKLRTVIRKQHGEHPKLPIFLVGDFNRHKALELPAKVEYIRVKGAKGVPIDQSYATGSVRTSKVERLKRFGSDHHAYRFTATF